jgi:hypothetical protein
MKLFLCRWPNGDLSIAAGRSLEEIDDVLDEVGDGHDAELIPIKGRFALHLKLKQEIGDADTVPRALEVEDFDECSYDRLGDAYPILHSAFYNAIDPEDGEPEVDLEGALVAERSRPLDPKKSDVLDGHCCYGFGKGDEVAKKLMRHGKTEQAVN